MGGGQANKGQASAADKNTTAATNQSMSYAGKDSSDLQRYQDLMFGKSSALPDMFNKSNLDSSTLTGPYKLRYEQAVNQGAEQNQNANRGIVREAANRGLGLSTPAVAEMERHNALDLGRSRGEAFSDAVGNQHNEALQNFWGAENIAGSQSDAARSGRLQGTGQAGQTQANLYGTAGAYHQGAAAGIVGSAIGAAGQVGAASMTGGASTAAGACPADGSLILTDKGYVPVEELKCGDLIAQLGGGYARLKCDPIPSEASLLLTQTSDGFAGKTSTSHCFSGDIGGYLEASEASGRGVRTFKGRASVVHQEGVGRGTVRKIESEEGSNHTYCADGIWALE